MSSYIELADNLVRGVGVESTDDDALPHLAKILRSVRGTRGVRRRFGVEEAAIALAANDSEFVESDSGDLSTGVFLAAGFFLETGRQVHVFVPDEDRSLRLASEWAKGFEELGFSARTTWAGIGRETRREIYRSDVVLGSAESLCSDFLRDIGARSGSEFLDIPRDVAMIHPGLTPVAMADKVVTMSAAGGGGLMSRMGLRHFLSLYSKWCFVVDSGSAEKNLARFEGWVATLSFDRRASTRRFVSKTHLEATVRDLELDIERDHWSEVLTLRRRVLRRQDLAGLVDEILTESAQGIFWEINQGYDAGHINAVLGVEAAAHLVGSGARVEAADVHALLVERWAVRVDSLGDGRDDFIEKVILTVLSVEWRRHLGVLDAIFTGRISGGDIMDQANSSLQVMNRTIAVSIVGYLLNAQL